MTWSRALIVASLAVPLAACAAGITHFDRGVAFYQSGQYLPAKDEFTEVIRVQPRSAAAWTNRGITKVRLGDLPGAVDDYSRALELTPDDPEIYFNRGNALALGGYYAQAAADYSRAIELSPAYARALFNRGTALANLGDRIAAEADWRRALAVERDPWARASMTRSMQVALAPPAPGAVVKPGPSLAPPPPLGTASGGVAVPIGPTPPVPPAATIPVPLAPGAEPQAIDARALANRAVTRELDGDRAGAIQDLRAALGLETDPRRRASIENLLRSLEAPR